MTTLVDPSHDIDELKPGIIALRRELHPELAFEEVWTAATLAGRMRSLGLAVEEGIGGTGVLAVLEGARPGKTLLVRADMDALPMDDTTGVEYASALANRNHACGHDVHSAVVAGVAEVLARHRDRIAGRLAFVFQRRTSPCAARSECRRRPGSRLPLGRRTPYGTSCAGNVSLANDVPSCGSRTAASRM